MKSGSHIQQFLADLIAIPSVNPAFTPEGHPDSGEQAMVEFLRARALAAGLPAEVQQVFPNRCNVLVKLPPTAQMRSRVVLAPHLDTVGLPGEWKGLFQPRVAAGRVYGRGACDTKGCVAAMFSALTRVASAGQRPAHTEIIFAGLVDEENGQAGSRALVKNGFKADLAIIGEPTRLEVITAHKGDVWLRLDTRGKAAHGARPELGINAVHEMARIVDLLETEYAAQLRRKRHPLLGRGTINVGSIRGGTQPNIVPAQCSITIDRRTLPGENEAVVRREIRELLKRRKLKASLASARYAPCLALETDPKLPLVAQLMRLAGQRQPAGVDFFCDAAVLANGGIPSVVFGPGDIAQAHTVDEWISVRSLEAGAALLEEFLRSLP